MSTIRLPCDVSWQPDEFLSLHSIVRVTAIRASGEPCNWLPWQVWQVPAGVAESSKTIFGLS